MREYLMYAYVPTLTLVMNYSKDTNVTFLNDPLFILFKLIEF